MLITDETDQSPGIPMDWYDQVVEAKAGIPEQQPGVAQATCLGRLAQGMPVRDQPGIHGDSSFRLSASAASMAALTRSGV